VTPTIGARGAALGGVLHDLDFALPHRSCTAVLGANGAGKSTLLAGLAGALPPAAGQLFCRRPSAWLAEGAPLDPWVRVGRWVQLARGLPGWEPAVGDALLAALELPLRRQVSQLSQGQRVRLGLVMTLGRRAPVYLLDDPFLGLDPMARVVAERFIAERAADATVVIANQDASASERLCSHLLLLRGGTVSWYAPVDAWRARFRRLRVRAPAAAIDALGLIVLQAIPRGTWTELLIDDPAEVAEGRLLAAGARVEPAPLPLDELLLTVVAA